MKKIIPFFIMICCLLAVSSCSYDNFEEPKATLTGKAIYDGEAVGVRSGSSEFALFQDGYALKGSIPVYIAQDGSYSVSLFNGDYKLVRMGNAPWERPSNDTIYITVRGNTVQDIPVTPYFFVRNVSFAKNGNKITARFTINKVVANAKQSINTIGLDGVLYFLGFKDSYIDLPKIAIHKLLTFKNNLYFLLSCRRWKRIQKGSFQTTILSTFTWPRD